MYTVENVRAIADKLLYFGGVIAMFTPNKVDDKVVEVLKTLVLNDGVVQLFVDFLNSTNKDNAKPSQERVVAAFMEHFA